LAYHLSESGCVGEEILGAEGVPETAEGAVVSGTAGAVGATPSKLNQALPKLVKIFVPLPSFANAKPEEKVNGALLAALTVKVIVMALPFEPVKPGFKTMPSKFTVPAEFENDGSCTQRVKIEPVLEREVTSSLSLGNEITPDAAFIA